MQPDQPPTSFTYLSQNNLKRYLEHQEIQHVSRKLVQLSRSLHQVSPCNMQQSSSQQRPPRTSRSPRSPSQQRPPRTSRSPRSPRSQQPPTFISDVDSKHIKQKQEQILLLLGKLGRKQQEKVNAVSQTSPRLIEKAYKELMRDTRKKLIEECVIDGEHHRNNGRHLRALASFNRAVLFKEKEKHLSVVLRRRQSDQLRQQQQLQNQLQNRTSVTTAGGTVHHQHLPTNMYRHDNTNVATAQWKLSSSPLGSPVESPLGSPLGSPLVVGTQTVPVPAPPLKSWKSRKTRKCIRQKITVSCTKDSNTSTGTRIPTSILNFGRLPAETNYRKIKRNVRRWPVQPPRARFEEEDSILLKSHREKQLKWERSGILYSRERGGGGGGGGGGDY